MPKGVLLRTFKLSFLFVYSSARKKRLDNVDKVIWILPFLAVFDVVSTLYLESLGYSLTLYETGLFARFFVSVGLFYFSIPIYLLIIAGFAYVFWYIKNRKLDSSNLFDKAIFLMLVGVTCYFCMRLTDAFIGNLSLPYLVTRETSRFSIALLVYLSTAFTLSVYLWRDVVTWVMASGDKTGK
jgi:hypothetical protein